MRHDRPDKLRVGILSTWNIRCGIAEYSSYLVNSLRNSSGDIRVYSNREHQTVKQDDEFVSRAWSHSEDTLPALLASVAQDRREVVVIEYHPAFYPPALLGTLVRKLWSQQIAVLVCPHIVQTPAIDFAAIAQDLLPAVLQVHRDSDRQYLEQFGITNVCVIPQGLYIPNHMLGEIEAPFTGFRSRPGGEVVIGSFGFMMPHKGFMELLAATAIVRRRSPNVKLRIFSSLYPSDWSLSFWTRLRAFRSFLAAEDWCYIDTDFRLIDEVIEDLAGCDALVFPYQHTPESSSAAVRTGLAANRPVLCTPIHIFDDVRNVVHSSAGTDPFSIADGIWRLLTNQEMAAIVSKQKSFLQSNSWSAIAPQILNAAARRT